MSTIIDDRHWIKLGACRGMPVRRFYPERGENEMGAEAKRVCAACPMRGPCREAGILMDEDGVWGGLTKRDRREVVYRRVEVRMEHGSGYRALIKYCQCRNCQAARLRPLQAQLHLRPWPERLTVDARIDRAEQAAAGQSYVVKLAKVVDLLDHKRRRARRTRCVTPELGLIWRDIAVGVVAA